jgi:signal transduction histidine kinase
VLDPAELSPCKESDARHLNDVVNIDFRREPQASCKLGKQLKELGNRFRITRRYFERLSNDCPFLEDLVELPAMTDVDALALMKVLRSSLPAAFQLQPALGALLTARMVLMSLEHGNCSASAQAYGTFAGVLLESPLHDLAYRFGKLGIDLNRRLDDRASRSAVEFLFGLFSAPWFAPIGEAIDQLRDAAQCGRDYADHIHGGNAGALEISHRMFRGAEPLTELCRDARVYRQRCREVNEPATARLLTWHIDRLRVLMGEIDGMSSDSADSQLTLRAVREEANIAQQFNFLHMLVDTSYATGNDDAALAFATAARALEPMTPRMLAVVDHRFWHSLAAIAVSRRQPARCPALEPVIDANQRELARLAAACPDNFEAMHLLVEAERSSLTGDLAATLAGYERATAIAARHGMRRLEALANELHGQLWLARDTPEIAHIYLGRARSMYARLDMHRKIDLLDRKLPGLARIATPRLTGTVTSSTAAEVLDVTAIAKATRAISGELELDNLLARMLDILCENAGADSGALVLDDPHGLTVAASRAPGAHETSTVNVPLDAAALPRSIIYYVQRTDCLLVLDHAAADPRFANDDYLRNQRSRSVLCMPVKHKERAIGMVYLENTLVTGAFTQARLDALTILASQLAVSLENATLFAAQRQHNQAIARANQELRAEIEIRHQAETELARYRDHLEELIAERTGELTCANQKLRAAAAERERIEAELRLAQKLESVGRLAAGVAHEIAAHEYKYVADVATELGDLPPVRCNAGEINQAVLNLVINAAHAIRDVVGQTGARGKITVSTRHDAGEVEIAISDTGTGIAPEIRDQIYDPFFTTKEVGRGTGQGLAIVRSVVDKHGGSLRFDTEPGAGTTFFLRLPVGPGLDPAGDLAGDPVV